MSEHRSIFRSAGVIGFFTLLSRIAGFIRDIIIARLFGTTLVAQAFVVAFRIPNTFRDLVGEGAASSAIIPIFSEYSSRQDRKEFWRLVNVVMTVATVILSLGTLVGVLLAPVVVRVVAFGFADDPAKMQLTITLTRIMFPFILFISLASLVMSALNTLKDFTVSAASPCLMNIIMIITGLWIAPRLAQPVLGMAFAVLLGGFTQLAAQLPVLYAKGFVFSWTADWAHPALRRIVSLLAPRIVGSSIYQLNIFIDTMFASMGRIVGEGAVAALYYANRLVQFPTAIFGLALATAFLPTLSRQAVTRDFDDLKRTLRVALRGLMLFLIPSSVGLMVLAHPIVKILFERGKFDAAATQMTSFALLFYSFGVVAYGGARMVASCFYSLQDTRTPVKVTAACMMVNIFLNYAFMWRLQAGGLALATAVTSMGNLLGLLWMLRRKIGPLGLRQTARESVPVIVSSALMAVACVSAMRFLNVGHEALRLLIAIGAGIGVFISAGAFLGVFRGVRVRP